MQIDALFKFQTKIRHENLVKFMKAARFLQVRGLVEVGEDQLKEQNARLAIKNKSKEVPRKRAIAPKRKPDFVVSEYDTDDSVISCFYLFFNILSGLTSSKLS